MSNLNDIHHAGTQKAIGARVLNKAVLAINAASAATVKTTNALTYTIDGILLTKAALAAQALVFDANLVSDGTPQGYVQPASTTVYYLLIVNGAGLVRCVQGSYSGQPIRGGEQKLPGGLPVVPNDFVPFGLIKVTTNGATTFTPGTTALDAAGLTVTFYDLSQRPSVAP